MPYKASARPFFFPSAGRRSAIAAFHSEMFPLLLRGTTLPPHDDPFRTRGGRHPCPPIRLRQSVRGPAIEYTDRSPAHTDEDISLRVHDPALQPLFPATIACRSEPFRPGKNRKRPSETIFTATFPRRRPAKGRSSTKRGSALSRSSSTPGRKTKVVRPRRRIATRSTPPKRKSGAAPVRTHSQPGPGRQRQVGKFGKTPVCRNTEPMTEIISATVCINPDIFVIL